jgi:hypothetical protein
VLPGVGICDSSKDMDYGSLLCREESYMLQNPAANELWSDFEQITLNL